MCCTGKQVRIHEISCSPSSFLPAKKKRLRTDPRTDRRTDPRTDRRTAEPAYFELRHLRNTFLMGVFRAIRQFDTPRPFGSDKRAYKRSTGAKPLLTLLTYLFTRDGVAIGESQAPWQIDNICLTCNHAPFSISHRHHLREKSP